ALAVFDDGSGPALYAGGLFTSAGGAAANHVAKWNGTTWSALGTGITGTPSAVQTLAVHDDGTGAGPALYAGGTFTSAGGVPANQVAKWNGLAWSALGSGMTFPGTTPDVLALTSFDDGSGSGARLYAGGNFSSAGGVAAKYLARWDGTSWSSLGAVNQVVTALCVTEDDDGPGLFVGGDFTRAGVFQPSRVARWSGSSWATLGSGISQPIESLTVF